MPAYLIIVRVRYATDDAYTCGEDTEPSALPSSAAGSAVDTTGHHDHPTSENPKCSITEYDDHDTRTVNAVKSTPAGPIAESLGERGTTAPTPPTMAAPILPPSSPNAHVQKTSVADASSRDLGDVVKQALPDSPPKPVATSLPSRFTHSPAGDLASHRTTEPTIRAGRFGIDRMGSLSSEPRSSSEKIDTNVATLDMPLLGDDQVVPYVSKQLPNRPLATVEQVAEVLRVHCTDGSIAQLPSHKVSPVAKVEDVIRGLKDVDITMAEVTRVLEPCTAAIPLEESDNGEGESDFTDLHALDSAIISNSQQEVLATPAHRLTTTRFNTEPVGEVATPPTVPASRPISLAQEMESTPSAEPTTPNTPLVQQAVPLRFAVTTVHKDRSESDDAPNNRTSLPQLEIPIELKSPTTNVSSPTRTSGVSRFAVRAVSPDKLSKAIPFDAHGGLLAPPDLDGGHGNKRIIPFPNSQAVEYIRYFFEADGTTLDAIRNRSGASSIEIVSIDESLTCEIEGSEEAVNLASSMVQEALLSFSLEGGEGRPNLRRRRRDEDHSDSHDRLLRKNWRQLLQKIDNEIIGYDWTGHLSHFGSKVPCATTMASRHPVRIQFCPALMHDAHVYCVQCRKCFCNPSRNGSSNRGVHDCFVEIHKNLDPPHQVIRLLRRKADILADIKDMLRNLQKDRLDDITVFSRETMSLEALDTGKTMVLEVSFVMHSGRAVDELRSELTQLDALHPTDAYELMVIDLLTKYPARVTDGGDLAYGVRKAARITQSQIKDKVTSSAQLTTDYLLFVVAAALIAAAGLASDDVVSTVASMLISPIMGPIMAFTYGASIFNFGMSDSVDPAVTFTALQFMAKGAFAEFISLLLCIIIGFVIGLATSPWADEFGFPSDFMESRGQPLALLYGLAIAIPSGLGVALSIAGDNSGGLVGVAISASLLPPAVNTGMCWGLAAAIDNESDSHELARIGAFSLSLTLLNICSIIVVAGAAFKWKEIREYDSRERTMAVLNLINQSGLESKFQNLSRQQKQRDTSESVDTMQRSGARSVTTTAQRRPTIFTDVGPDGQMTNFFDSRVAVHVEISLAVPNDDVFKVWGMKWNHDDMTPVVEFDGVQYVASRVSPTADMLRNRIVRVMIAHVLPQHLAVNRHRGDIADDYDIDVETTQGKTPNTASIKIAIKDVPPTYVESADAIDFRRRQAPPPGFLEGVVAKLRAVPVPEWFASPRPILPDDHEIASKNVIVYEEPREIIVQLVQDDDSERRRKSTIVKSRSSKYRSSIKHVARSLLSPLRRSTGSRTSPQ